MVLIMLCHHLCCGYRFQVQFPDNLGDIYKVRVGFASDTDQDENWLLDSVRSAAMSVRY